MAVTNTLLLLTLLAHPAIANAGSVDSNLVQLLGPQGVNLWKLNIGRIQSFQELQDGEVTWQESQSPLATRHFHTRWFEQPLDHFSNTSETWLQRYWVNDRHYKPDSGRTVPVIVIDGGETSGEDRLPFLDTGIAEILANATGGIGIVLEHRYAR